MAMWFECKVRFDKTMENGTVKKVTESYLVDALSSANAESLVSLSHDKTTYRKT